MENELEKINIENYSKEPNIDHYTLEDIIKCLKQPSRDFRDDFTKPLLKSNILKIEDLRIGMELEGTVRNVVDFGAFIDIGLHNDGLVHISKISKEYIKHPSEVLSVGDIVDCYVDEIFKDKVPVSSTKPLTGHCLGAAAGIETALCCKLLDDFRGKFYPNINADNIVPEISQINLVKKDDKYKKCKIYE